MDIKIFTERLLKGDIIPFIGSDIHLLSQPSIISPAELALKLSDHLSYQNYNNSPVTLPTICQYYQMEHDRSALLNTAGELLEQNCAEIQENPIFQLLSEIENPLLIISSLYDNELEKVFEKDKKPYVLISHQLQSDSDDYGKLLIKYSDRDQIEAPCTKEALSGQDFFENGRSVIYKIFGSYNLCDTNPIDRIDPLMIAEHDFFNFLKLIENIIPDYLVRRISRQSLLFLGYNLNNWHDRLIATAILEKKIMRSAFSYAIRKKPNDYEKSFWNFFKVKIQEIGLWDYIRELRSIMPDIQSAKTAKIPNFDVFLCHNSKDKPAVKEIGDQLKAEGIKPWLDEWELRPGFPWQRALEEQIENIKSAAVFIGKYGIGPWQDLEQQAFIHEFKDRKCSVIPVFLPDCPEDNIKLPPFLKLMHAVDFRKTDPDPLKQLICGITGKKTD